MLLGCVSSAYNQVKGHSERIKYIKKKHNYYGEIKWSKVSNSQFEFYKELLDYFFSTDLSFRALVINKDQVNNEGFGQNYDEFYYKMYYQLLNHQINSEYAYNVFLDIKDDLSARKVRKLKEILNTKYGVFRNIQNIRSNESVLLQMADFIMGAISYELNNIEKKVIAKVQLIEKIRQHSGQDLIHTSKYNDNKLNLFFIELR